MKLPDLPIIYYNLQVCGEKSEVLLIIRIFGSTVFLYRVLGKKMSVQ